MNEREKQKFIDFYYSGKIRGRYYLEFPLGMKRLLEEAQERKRLSRVIGESENSEDFWERLLLSGLKWADVICIEAPDIYKGSYEEDVMEIGKRRLKDLKINVREGWKMFKDEFRRAFLYRRVWVIEVEETLNDESIVQVLTYASIFEEDFNKKAYKGIICNSLEPRLLGTCRKNNIQVWKI